jgi:disulfide bond formation protein DsbB
MRGLVKFGNLLGAAGMAAVLLIAFVFQFRFDELPGPLGLLQRVAFVLCGFGFLLNLRFGSQPLHYGLILLGALYGIAASGRQTLLHIVPGSGAYGAPVLGLHSYVWALVLFFATLAGVALLLILSGEGRAPREWHEPRRREPFGGLARIVAWLLIIATLGNAAATLALCGPIECPDNPTRYWLKAYL